MPLSIILELLEALIAGAAGAGVTATVLRAWLTRSVITVFEEVEASAEPAIDTPEAYKYHAKKLAYHREKRGEAMRQA